MSEEFKNAICNSIQENKDKIEKLTKQNERLKKQNKKLKEDKKKAIEHIRTHTKIIPFNEIGEGGGLELTDYDIADLLTILGDKE